MSGPQYRGKTREILLLASEGTKQKQIAYQLGCSQANVSRALSRHKWHRPSLRQGPLKPEQIEFIDHQAKARGVSYELMLLTLLAQNLNVSRLTNG